MSLALLALLARARKFLASIPWQVWAALALAAALYGAVAYHRHAVSAAYSDGYTAGVADEAARWTAAQAEAERLAIEAKAEAERKYADLAGRIDDEADKARADALNDAERWIAAHRVRLEDGAGSPGGTAAAPEDHGTGNGQGPGASPLVDAVVVAAEDVRICTANTLQAEAGRRWALELEGAN